MRPESRKPNRNPARYFTYFQEIDTPIVEGLVVPMYVDNLPVGTIWIVSHNEHVKFDAEDARVMTSLGSFAAAALKSPVLSAASAEHGNLHAAPVRGGRELVWKEYVRRIAHEDHSALSALLNETSPLVFATALRVLSFRADAEEVTTDVYHRIWRTAESYDPQRGSVDAWLVSIARSRAIDRLRTRAARGSFRNGAVYRMQQRYRSGKQCRRVANQNPSAASATCASGATTTRHRTGLLFGIDDDGDCRAAWPSYRVGEDANPNGIDQAAPIVGRSLINLYSGRPYCDGSPD
ncbi:MAG TPA: sigma factor [Bryobacteraceae bacterium]